MRSIRTISTFVVLGLVACGGSDGADGARGAAGDPGAAGAAGVPGAIGPAGSAATTPPAAATQPPRLLDARIGGWKAANRDRLNALLTEYGRGGTKFDPAKPPVAIFDWDNTILKNDIGDATFFWMIKHDKILQPSSWASTSAYLSPAALSALDAACGGLAATGQPLPTSTAGGVTCADTIVKVYDDESTPAGEPAWTSGEITSQLNADYAWVAQLTAGYAPEEVRGFARAAYEENAFAPIGTTQTIGDLPGYNAYVRVYDQMADLIGALQEDGFDVWITTASPQFFVDAISESTVGVKQNHVLGIRSMLQNGVVTTNLEGCGTIADAQNTMITFDAGKRCWVNKVVYSEPPATQMPSNTDPAKRAVFVAGDSDTDIAFVKDGAVLKLVIDRHKIQLMCNALANYANKWIWEPMFIAPKAAVTGPYACSTAKDHDGNPIVNEVGALIPDQSP